MQPTPSPSADHLQESSKKIFNILNTRRQRHANPNALKTPHHTSYTRSAESGFASADPSSGRVHGWASNDRSAGNVGSVGLNFPDWSHRPSPGVNENSQHSAWDREPRTHYKGKGLAQRNRVLIGMTSPEKLQRGGAASHKSRRRPSDSNPKQRLY